MRRAGRSLAQLTEDLPLMPQSLVNVRLAAGFDWKTHEPLRSMLDQVQRELSGQGRVLIRPSGTEPLLRVMVEAGSEASAQALARRLADCVPAA
jgi:phosphoglucosamine mutase